LFDEETVPGLNLSGENKETCAGADVRPCNKLPSVTCTVVAEGEDGAVYRPEDVIVPVAVDPPETPLTIQVGFATLKLSPVAVNCSIWPGNRIALAGVIVAGTTEV
jgi:hypothetical protein